ncbi:MAG: shikimate kinase [Actinomycetota bacterium]
MIRLIGPGGAGKSTVGSALATQLGVTFLDLDEEFMKRVGDISIHIDHMGYESYARENVGIYMSMATVSPSVIALSSGFMTYPYNIHSDYVKVRAEIADSPTTFVLIPSVDFETCVHETVRRQVGRPFGRSSEREEAVIRERYAIYLAIPSAKIETKRPVGEIVEQIADLLPPNTPLCRPMNRD